METKQVTNVMEAAGFQAERVNEWNGYRNGYFFFPATNSRGETLAVEVSYCESDGKRGSIPYCWHKRGFTPKIYKTYWSVRTFVTDPEGMCRRAYDPTIKLSDDGKRQEINFAWLFEGKPETLKRIIDEVIRLYMEGL